MQLELLRLSLLERRQQDAFAERSDTGKPFTREQWLRRTFSSPIKFQHRKELFHYVPQPSTDTPILFGRVGRQVSVQEHEPPEAGLQETQRDAWRAAAVLIDPQHHDDGQKVAFEHDPRVGRPAALFHSLAAHINRRDPPVPFTIEVHPISEASDFWQFVRENKGDITSVVFELVAPNMFGSEDDYEKELREMRDKERIQRLELKLESSEGLELETSRIEGAVNYAMKGGGSVRARTRQRRRFNSKDKVRSVNIPEKKLTPLEVIKLALSEIFKL